MNLHLLFINIFSSNKNKMWFKSNNELVLGRYLYFFQFFKYLQLFLCKSSQFWWILPIENLLLKPLLLNRDNKIIYYDQNNLYFSSKYVKRKNIVGTSYFLSLQVAFLYYYCCSLYYFKMTIKNFGTNNN